MIEKTIKKALFKESKLPVIQNIKKAISEKKFNEKVEENDIILNIKEKQKIVKKVEKKRNSLIYPVKNTVVNSVLNKLIKKVKILDEIEIEYNGKKEEMKKIKNGAIITLNHVHPLDFLPVLKLCKEEIKKKLYIIVEDSSFARHGIDGHIINYSNTILLTNLYSYLKKDFNKYIKEKIDEGNFVLIYPEEEMWINYKKPRPTKMGTYLCAAKYNIPIISCFLEIKEKVEKVSDEFKDVKFKIYIADIIEKKENLEIKDKAIYLKNRDFKAKKNMYEKIYNKKLDYTFEKEDIVGWIGKEL